MTTHEEELKAEQDEREAKERLERLLYAAERQREDRSTMVRMLSATALGGLIQHYQPDPYNPHDPTDPKAVRTLRTVPTLSPEQIAEIALSAYELAEATLQAIEIGEKAQENGGLQVGTLEQMKASRE